MSKNDNAAIRVDKKFVKNLNELYPQEIGFRNKTKRLNKVLEDMLYGKKE